MLSFLNESWAGFSLSVLHVQGRYMYVFGASNIFETIPFCWVCGSARVSRDARSAYLRRAKVSRQTEFYTSLHLSLSYTLTTATLPFAHVMSASDSMLFANDTHCNTSTNHAPPAATTPLLVTICPFHIKCPCVTLISSRPFQTGRLHMRRGGCRYHKSLSKRRG